MDIKAICIVEVICNTDKETDRLKTLNIITDHYAVSPGCIVYGEEAKGHPYYSKFIFKLNQTSLAINHIMLMEKYKDSDMPLLIFESDVLCLHDLTIIDSKLKQVIADMKTHAIDFVFLGKGCFPSVDSKNYKHIVNDLYKSSISRCTESYIISPRGMKAYLDFFNSTNNHTAIDADYNILFNTRPDILCCWSLPELFKQGSLTGLYSSLIPQ